MTAPMHQFSFYKRHAEFVDHVTLPPTTLKMYAAYSDCGATPDLHIKARLKVVEAIT
jgi:hypothetical protein